MKFDKRFLAVFPMVLLLAVAMVSVGAPVQIARASHQTQYLSSTGSNLIVTWPNGNSGSHWAATQYFEGMWTNFRWGYCECMAKSQSLSIHNYEDYIETGIAECAGIAHNQPAECRVVFQWGSGATIHYEYASVNYPYTNNEVHAWTDNVRIPLFGGFKPDQAWIQIRWGFWCSGYFTSSHMFLIVCDDS